MTSEVDLLQKIIAKRTSLIMEISQSTGELHIYMQKLSGLEVEQLKQNEIIEAHGATPEQEQEGWRIQQESIETTEKMQKVESRMEQLEQEVLKLDKDISNRLDNEKS